MDCDLIGNNVFLRCKSKKNVFTTNKYTKNNLDIIFKCIKG